MKIKNTLINWLLNISLILLVSIFNGNIIGKVLFYNDINNFIQNIDKLKEIIIKQILL